MTYGWMRSILKNYSDADPSHAAKLTGFAHLGAVNTDFGSLALLRDLSEYVALYSLATPVVTSEVSDVMYRQGSGNWLAFPAASIRGNKVLLGDIGGDFVSNSFLGYGDILHPKPSGLSLPKRTTVTVKHVNPWTSQIRLTNDYVTVTIGLEIALHRSGGIAILKENQFPQAWLFGSSDHAQTILAERNARYFIAEAVLHFDAEFDRIRYGFQKMRDHEAWVEDLVALLERRFAWRAIEFDSVLDLPMDRLGSTTDFRGNAE